MEYTLNTVREQLKSNPKWQRRALLVIFNNQENDEKVAETVRYHNGKGFNSADAKILTSIAKQYIQNKTISEKQQYVIAQRIPKYARQVLVKIKENAQ